MMTIHGRHYFATSGLKPASDTEPVTWLIMRGRFVLSQFIGTTEELIYHLETWDLTVSSKEPPMTQNRQTILHNIEAQLQSAISDLETVLSEDRETFEEMTEKQQESEKGEKLSENISALEEAIIQAEEAISCINQLN